jgi:hypothetical protein
VYLGDSDEKNYTENCQMLQKLIDVSCGDGMVYFPENHLTPKVRYFTQFSGLQEFQGNF